MSSQQAATFQQIGSLYYDWDGDRRYYIGRIVALPFVTGGRGLYEANRGPFETTKDFLSSYQKLVVKQIADEDVVRPTNHSALAIEDAGKIEYASDEASLSYTRWYTPANLELISKILSGLGRITSKLLDDEPVGPTQLFHHDLHENNLLVDDSGNITAVLDWEGIMAFPSFMISRPKVTEFIGQLGLSEAECRHLRSRFKASWKTPTDRERMIVKLAQRLFSLGIDTHGAEKFINEAEEYCANEIKSRERK